MNKRERRAMARDIRSRLNDLDFDLDYEMSDYHDQGTSIVDVDINIYDNAEDWPSDWDCQVEDVIDGIVDDWGGWYSWDGWCISVSVPDDDD